MAQKRRPPKVSKLIRILAGAGISVVACLPTEHSTRTYPGCWSLSLIDPVHNHYCIWEQYYERYTERAGLKLFALTNRPGGERGALVGIIVGKPRKE